MSAGTRRSGYERILNDRTKSQPKASKMDNRESLMSAHDTSSDSSARTPAKSAGAFAGGVAIGAVGGLIGLGGAEFRLPLLISVFRFGPLEAIILNKATSLIVVASALVFRTKIVPVELLASYWTVVVNLLAGSLLGAWLGASWATRLHSATLYKLIALLLVGIAIVLVLGHAALEIHAPFLQGWTLWIVGAFAGLVIGIVASLLGVAGGELLIPTFVLLSGIDIKLAGSLSLAVSLPTMLVGFARYSRDQSFTVLVRHRWFLILMAAGSIAGTFIGAYLLGFTSGSVLYPLLALILVLSALNVTFRGGSPPPA